MVEAYGLTSILGEGTFLYGILSVMNECGNIVFANLPLLFAMGVALGMAIKAHELGTEGAVVANITLFAVLVYELIGPFLTKIALLKAGEINPEEKVSSRGENVKA